MGIYPEVSLKLARRRRDEARKLLAQDIDLGASIVSLRRMFPPTLARSRLGEDTAPGPPASRRPWRFGTPTRRGAEQSSCGDSCVGATRPRGGWGGRADPNSLRCRSRHPEGRGRSRPRTQAPGRHCRSGDRNAIARHAATCGISGAHIGMAFSWTCAPMSDVHAWISTLPGWLAFKSVG